MGKTSKKLSSRINKVQKLAGVSWGANTALLRASSIILIYSKAEYCVPVWRNSCHTTLIDVKLNQTMRIITGTVRSTTICWLPVLCNIAPPDLRRHDITAKLLRKTLTVKNSLLYFELLELPASRHVSRNLVWNDFEVIESLNIRDT